MARKCMEKIDRKKMRSDDGLRRMDGKQVGCQKGQELGHAQLEKRQLSNSRLTRCEAQPLHKVVQIELGMNIKIK